MQAVAVEIFKVIVYHKEWKGREVKVTMSLRSSLYVVLNNKKRLRRALIPLKQAAF